MQKTPAHTSETTTAYPDHQRGQEFCLRAAIAGVAGATVGLLALMLWGVVERFRENALEWLPYPFARQGSEGLIIYQTLLMRSGEDVYGPITPTSFISAPYPPLYYWLAGRIMPADRVEFFDGRSLSLWASIMAALAVGLISVALLLRRDMAAHKPGLVHLAGGLVGGLVAAGIWLAQPAVLIWSTRFRADMLAVGLMVWGIVFVALGVYVFPAGPPEAHKPGPLIWLAVPAFVLALYTKQTMLAGPLAAAIFLLLRDRRTGIIWTLGVGLVGLVPFAILDLNTRHWFYLKMVDYHNLPFDIRTLRRLAEGFWEDHAALAVLGVIFLLWRIWRRKLDLPLLFLLANVLLLPTGGVVGADTNHFLAIGLALAICAGLLLAEAGAELAGLFKVGSRLPLLAAGSLLLLSSLITLFFMMAATPTDRFSPESMTSEAEQTQLKATIEMIRNTPGEQFFADDPGVLALAGKRTSYDDLFTVTALAKAGRWDQSALVEQLRSGAFPLVLLAGDAFAGPDEPRPIRSDIMSSEMIAGLCAGYRILYRDVIFTYAPREGQRGQLVGGRCHD